MICADRIAGAFERWNARFASMGVLALAALASTVVTGVVLAVGYDVGAPLVSLGELELSSLSGRLLRALHAWTGHLVVIFSALHVVEHLATASDQRTRYGVWLRLVLAVFVIFGVMVTGFVLKGDAEGQLARQIVAGLLERLPLVGAALSTALLGAGSDLQLIYIHHAATFTVLLAVIVIEHGRRIWPSAAATLAVLVVSSFLGWLLPPSLHDGIEPVIKGPWYFVGLQEGLHWLTRPAWLWLLLLVPTLVLAALPRLDPPWRRRALWTLVVLLALYTLTGAWAQWFRGAGWRVTTPWSRSATPSRAATGTASLSFASVEDAPVVLGRPEGCVVCHRQVTGLVPGHDPAALGCASCHLGNPFAADADAAHRGMVRVPGNLDTAALSCGQTDCHEDLVRRVEGSLMATVRGMIAVDRWAFGEQPTPDGLTAAADLGDSPADTHLRQMCISCHLGRTKSDPGPITELSRGGGCVACHLQYPEARDYAPDHSETFTHPALSVRVRDDACFGCHSRSGRISLGYAGWWESHDGEAERTLEDGRTLRRTSADAHHDKGMACIDCHSARETMGDGETHLHEELATRVRCQTCHRTAPARSVALADLDAESRRILELRYGEEPPAELLAEDRTGEPLTNAWPGAEGTVAMRGKLSNKEHIGRPPAAACSQLAGHQRLSCRACHTTWVTYCVACHTQWDAGGERYDVLTGDTRHGAWAEYDGPPEIAAPVLGVLERHGETRIEPFAPGMVMTVNQPDRRTRWPLPDAAAALIDDKTRFVRAFALAVPHTTTRAGRSCASCHSDPRALGYGRGTLDLTGPTFDSAYEASRFDNLPGDAWMRFLSEPEGAVATRTQARPLDLAAQRRTLEVGVCLECHEPDSAIYGDYAKSRERLSAACRTLGKSRR